MYFFPSDLKYHFYYILNSFVLLSSSLFSLSIHVDIQRWEDFKRCFVSSLQDVVAVAPPFPPTPADCSGLFFVIRTPLDMCTVFTFSPSIPSRALSIKLLCPTGHQNCPSQGRQWCGFWFVQDGPGSYLLTWHNYELCSLSLSKVLWFEWQIITFLPITTNTIHSTLIYPSG